MFAQFFQCLVGESALPKGYFKKLSLLTAENSQSLNLSPEESQVVQLRYKAMASYWKGTLDVCLKHLREAYKLATQTEHFSQWLVSDILIDLRNLSNMQAEAQSKWKMRNKWQTLLDKQDTVLHYPWIDRLESDVYEKSYEILMDEKTTAPYTTKFAVGPEGIAKDVAHTFILSMLYGSLTQIWCSRRRMASVLSTYCSVYRSPEMFRNLIICAVMEPDKKMLEKLMRFYPGNGGADAVDAESADTIMNAVTLEPMPHKRKTAYLLLLQFLCYQFSDERFGKLESIVMIDVREFLQNGMPPWGKEFSILEALKQSAFRISSDFVAEVLIGLIQKGAIRGFSQKINLINILDYSRLSAEAAEQLVIAFSAAYNHGNPIGYRTEQSACCAS